MIVIQTKMDEKQKQPCKICTKLTHNKEPTTCDGAFGLDYVPKGRCDLPVCRDGCTLVCTSCTKSQQMPSSSQLYCLASDSDTETERQFARYFWVTQTHKTQKTTQKTIRETLSTYFKPKLILKLIDDYHSTTEMFCQTCLPTHRQGLIINPILDVFDSLPEDSIRRIDFFYV